MMARRQPKTGLAAVVREDLMTLREVARYADVLPSAVSNWKRRHDDFPNPIDVSSSGTLYRRSDMLDWLRLHGKLGPNAEHPEGFDTWETAASLAIGQMLREARPDEVRRIVLSTLLHAAISEGPVLRWRGRDPQQRQIPLSIDQDSGAAELIERFSDSEGGEGFPAALTEAWTRLEETNPVLEGLLTRAAPEQVQPGLTMMLLLAFGQIVSEGQGRDLDPLHRVLWDEIAPFESQARAEVTPFGLARLLVGLANGRGPSLLDLAAGSGSLVFDAIVERWRPEGPAGVEVPTRGDASAPDPETVDAYTHDVAMNVETHAELVDPNREALTEVRIWSLIYDVPVTLTEGRLAGDVVVQGQVDSLVVDAPAGVRPSADEQSSIDWLEENAAGDLDVGFLVAARKLLAANGRAAIAISTRVATARSARLIEARGDLINSGHIEAIIALPANLHDGRSRPISIVVMAGTPKAGPLLLVDATACGTQRRRHRELSEVETMGIVDIVRAWRSGQPIVEPENVRAVTIEPVDLEDNVLDAALYLPPPTLPDAAAIRGEMERVRDELRDVTAQLSSTLADLLKEQR